MSGSVAWSTPPSDEEMGIIEYNQMEAVGWCRDQWRSKYWTKKTECVQLRGEIERLQGKLNGVYIGDYNMWDVERMKDTIEELKELHREYADRLLTMKDSRNYWKGEFDRMVRTCNDLRLEVSDRESKINSLEHNAEVDRKEINRLAFALGATDK